MNRAGASGIDRKDASQFFLLLLLRLKQIGSFKRGKPRRRAAGEEITIQHFTLVCFYQPRNPSTFFKDYFILNKRYELLFSYLCIGDGWKRIVDTGSLCGHGEQSGHSERDSSRNCVGIQPERDPGNDDQHAAWNVDGDQVVGELPSKQKIHFQARVLSYKKIRHRELF